MLCKFKRVQSYWLLNIYKDTCQARIISFFYEIFRIAQTAKIHTV